MAYHDVSIFKLIFFTLKTVIFQLIWLVKPLPYRDEENVEGKVAIVTGANSGLGKFTAQELAKRGCRVVMACRNLVEGKKAMEEIRLNSGSNKVELMELNLADLSSVRRFANLVQEKYETIDILINNAGVYSTDESLSFTKDGFEMHMGTNHLGHFPISTS